MNITALTVAAGVAGSPVTGSLSPVLHNAWISAAGLDAVYLAFEPRDFEAFATGLKGGVIRGLNVTAPFKQTALEIADSRSERAARSGAANILIFERSGEIVADNSDGVGLLDAILGRAPRFDFKRGPVVICGAGGAARGAVAALVEAGAPCVRIVNRSADRAEALAGDYPGVVVALGEKEGDAALEGANLVINATPGDPPISLDPAPRSAVVVDMVYRPLKTPLLTRAEALGFPVVDGLAMLIAQARPSFEAFFGLPPPEVDVRSPTIRLLEANR